MPKTRINCPNCRQPIVADIEQLFDVGVDPNAKQLFLSGAVNIVQCPNCGYHGNLATPIVYHDPEKELLLTYVPPELGLPREEQERIIGPLINRVVNNLPQEKRKGYLFRPQTMLTQQRLIEHILEAEGITREMIQAQQQRLILLQRLINASDDVIAEVAKQEDKIIDGDFFAILNRLVDASLMGGDQESAQHLSDLQKKLLPLTTFGREYEQQTKEVEAAVKSLQEAGKDLTREKLLDLVIQAPNETRLSILVSLARPGMDYAFFQLLSERIDRARGDGRARLIQLRERLLELTQEVDKQMEVRAAQARQLLEKILKSKDISEATLQNLRSIDDFFVQALNTEMDAARKKGDLEKIGQLQQIVNTLQQASTPPAEVELIEELLDAPDEQTVQAMLDKHRQEITPEFIDTLTTLMNQTQSNQDPDLQYKIQMVYRIALRYSMEANLKK
jgi:hypothetical protein